MHSIEYYVLFTIAIILNVSGQEWYTGIDSIKVVSPQDDVATIVKNIHNEMFECQFCDKRYAVLLKRGNYGSLNIPVGYYTTIAGVGSSPSDVKVTGFYVLDADDGNDTCNFWRAVEGLMRTNSGTTEWRTSQGCSLRRIVLQGGLSLSGKTAFSSGGFVSDISVAGKLSCGTQTQFFFRNSEFGDTDCWGGINYVFVGVKGAPSTYNPDQTVVIESTPLSYEKPYLTENLGVWNIILPSARNNSIGMQWTDTEATSVPISDVYVAKKGDNADSINLGINGKAGLLLTPAIYEVTKPIRITTPGFVVLGIGFPTLIATKGSSAISVEAPNVRVAQVLLEAGSQKGVTTDPLIHWKGNDGIAFDIFTRVGSFKYRGCGTFQADVLTQIDGNNVIIDNTWNWHADHDDCFFNSNNCYSESGLRVMGRDVIAYGPSCEHTFKNILDWHGENGRVYFYQAELPYHDEDSKIVGYNVDYAVKRHEAYGIGVYIVKKPYNVITAIRVPTSASITNMIQMTIGGSASQFHNIVCTEQHCSQPEWCNQYSQCWKRFCCADNSIKFKKDMTKCLDLAGGNVDNGTPLQIWDCNDFVNQQWTFINNSIRYKALPSKCVDVPGGKTDNGLKLRLWDCFDIPGQKFNYDNTTFTFHYWANLSKCIDLSGGITSKSNPIEIWDCIPNETNQQWVF